MVKEFFFSSLALSAILGLVANRTRRIIWLAAGCIVAFLIFHVWALAIFAGGLLYLLYDTGAPFVRLSGQWKWLLLPYCLGAVFIKPGGPESFGVYCQAVLSALLIVAIALNAKPLQRLLGLSLFSIPGQASYSLYLISLPFQYTCAVFAAALIRAGRMTVWVWAALCLADIAIVTGLGYCLYRFAEGFLCGKLRIQKGEETV